MRSAPSSIFHGQGAPSLPTSASVFFPSKITIASDGGSPGFAPGVTTGGAGRLMSCTRHSVPGMIGVSSYPMGEGLLGSSAAGQAVAMRDRMARVWSFMQVAIERVQGTSRQHTVLHELTMAGNPCAPSNSRQTGRGGALQLILLAIRSSPR